MPEEFHYSLEAGQLQVTVPDPPYEIPQTVGGLIDALSLYPRDTPIEGLASVEQGKVDLFLVNTSVPVSLCVCCVRK